MPIEGLLLISAGLAIVAFVVGMFWRRSAKTQPVSAEVKRKNIRDGDHFPK